MAWNMVVAVRWTKTGRFSYILVAEPKNLRMGTGSEEKEGTTEAVWLLGLHTWTGQWCNDEKTDQKAERKRG